MRRFAVALAAATVSAPLAAEDPGGERLYGRVTTSEGVVVEGFLLWDGREAVWADFLDGRREVPEEHWRELEALDPELRRRAEQDRYLEAFGVRVTWERDDMAPPRTVSSAVRFGHVRAVTPLEGGRARLDLVDGTSATFAARSADVGRGVGSLLVWSADGAEHDLDWRDVERVELVRAPAGRTPPGRRLYGTLTTVDGLRLDGFVSWDLDETMDFHELDGEEGESGREWVLPMGDIASIERVDRRSARVHLSDGEVLVLRGTNDVDRDNRGIEISDPGFGRAVVRWDEFERLDLLPGPPEGAVEKGPAPSGTLRGTVWSEDGRAFEGAVRWVNHEQAGWELLDGRLGGVEYDVELAHVAAVVRADGVLRVSLRDGREVDLFDDDDAGPDNPGLVVTSERGTATLVRWRDFARLELAW